MPKFEINGVVVDISEEKAARIPGLKPVAAKKAPVKKATKAAAKKSDDE